MKRWVKWLLGVVAAVVVIVAAAPFLVPLLVDTPRVHALIVSGASQAIGRPVRFRSLTVSVLPLPAVVLHSLEIAEDPRFGTDPFLKLETGKVRIRLGPLLGGRVELGAITLKKPVITLIQAPDGRLNVATLGAAPEPRVAARPPRSSGGAAGAGAALGSTITIDGGVVTYVARGKGAAASQYRVEDLALTLAGGGPQLGVRGGFRLTPGDLLVKIADGRVALNAGTTLAEAPLSGTLSFEAKDIAELAKLGMGPSPALGGALRGTLALSGTLGSPAAAGEVELAKPSITQVQPACREPRQRTLALGTLKLSAGYRNQVIGARPLTTSLGAGTLSGQLTVSPAQGARVQLDSLAIKALPLEKLLVDYLCQGYAITGPLDFTGAASFSASDMWNTLSGPGTLAVGRGKVVGPQALGLVSGVVRLGGALSALLSADLPNLGDSPLEFDSITGTYQIVNGVLTTRDLLYTSRPMKVAIAGSYGLATGRMDLDMTIAHGRGELKAKITGTSSSPSIRVVPSTMLREVDRGKVGKGLSDLLKKLR